jgi:hypothetical protein
METTKLTQRVLLQLQNETKETIKKKEIYEIKEMIQDRKKEYDKNMKNL